MRPTAALFSLLTLAACQAETPVPDTTKAATDAAQDAANSAAKELQGKAAAVFKPLPTEADAGDNQLTDARIDLGRTLYFETRLSKNHDISCNSCHMLDKYGVDNLPTSPGHKGQLGGRNSPTVYNASLHVAQFWDGRAKDVEEQAGGPMVNPVEMAMADGSGVTAILKTIPGYQPMFEAAFPDDADPVSYDNAAIAIGAFERKLLTPAPFDAYLGGDLSALDPEQQEGLSVFMDTGCTTCHSGALVGGQAYFKLGLVKPFETADLGRFDVTGEEADKMVFKVPSLRNIDKTGPYFHDGKVTTLDEAITLMADHQLGKQLDQKQIGQIKAFLATLTGDLPTDYIKAPAMPESGPDTPAADPS